MTQLCESSFLNYPGSPPRARVALTGHTLRFSLHEALRLKHSTDTRRKLKKELAPGRHQEVQYVCVCNAASPGRALEVCLNCGVFIGPAAEMGSSAPGEGGEHACVALKGVAAVYGGAGSFNRVIHSVLSLREAGGADRLLQLNLINNPIKH